MCSTDLTNSQVRWYQALCWARQGTCWYWRRLQLFALMGGRPWAANGLKRPGLQGVPYVHGEGPRRWRFLRWRLLHFLPPRAFRLRSLLLPLFYSSSALCTIFAGFAWCCISAIIAVQFAQIQRRHRATEQLICDKCEGISTHSLCRFSKKICLFVCRVWKHHTFLFVKTRRVLEVCMCGNMCVENGLIISSPHSHTLQVYTYWHTTHTTVSIPAAVRRHFRSTWCLISFLQKFKKWACLQFDSIKYTQPEHYSIECSRTATLTGTF